MLDSVQSTRMGAVPLTDLMPMVMGTVTVTVTVTMTVSILAIIVLGMMLGLMFGTEVPTWLVHAAHDVSIPDVRQPDVTGWACG